MYVPAMLRSKYLLANKDYARHEFFLCVFLKKRSTPLHHHGACTHSRIICLISTHLQVRGSSCGPNNYSFDYML